MSAQASAAVLVALALGCCFAASAQQPSRADEAPWSFRTEADRRSVSDFFELFNSGFLQLELEINDGSGPSNEMPIAGLGYLRVRNGNIVRVNVQFVKNGDTGEATVRSLELKPVEAVQVAPGVRVISLKLSDTGVTLELERFDRRKGPAPALEAVSLELAGRTGNGGPVFNHRKPDGTVSQYRIAPDGGIQVLAAQWTDLMAAGKRAQVIPLSHWPPTLSDLMSWLPKPDSARKAEAANRTGTPAATRPRIPISRAQLRFAGSAARIELANKSLSAVEDLEVRIQATGLFEGTTFHAGSPDDLGPEADLTKSLNTVRAEFKLPSKSGNTDIPLKVQVNAAWQAAVPLFDLDNLSAGLAFQALATSSFALPNSDEDRLKLWPGTNAQLELRLRGRTVLGRRAASGRDVSFELDPTSEFDFRIPGPVKIAFQSESGEGPVDIPEQLLAGEGDAPVMTVKGGLASVKMGNGSNGVRVGAKCRLAFRSGGPILVRHTRGEDRIASELAPGALIALNTAIAADVDFALKDPHVEILPSLEWSANLINTTAKTAWLDLSAPGRIAATGKFEVAEREWLETQEVKGLHAEAKLQLIDPGAALSMRLHSMPAIMGELEPQGVLKIDTGTAAARKGSRSGTEGWRIFTQPDQGALTAAFRVRTSDRTPHDTVLTGTVDTNLDLRSQLDLFFANNEPLSGMLRFAGTAVLARKDPKAGRGLEDLLLPFRVFGQYGSPAVDEQEDGKLASGSTSR